MNNKFPPATRKAGIEMPIKPKTASPKAAKMIRTTAAMVQARHAMRLSCGVLELRQASFGLGQLFVGLLFGLVVQLAGV